MQTHTVNTLIIRTLVTWIEIRLETRSPVTTLDKLARDSNHHAKRLKKLCVYMSFLYCVGIVLVVFLLFVCCASCSFSFFYECSYFLVRMFVLHLVVLVLSIVFVRVGVFTFVVLLSVHFGLTIITYYSTGFCKCAN